MVENHGCMSRKWHRTRRYGGAAGSNYLVALGEMCYIDYFGKLMTGKEGSRENFRTFCKKYMTQYVGILDSLYEQVRSGLVHAYFPENVDVVGVSRETPGNAVWLEANRWKIAVENLQRELKTAADSLKCDLLKGLYLTNFKNVVTKDPSIAQIPSQAIGQVTTISSPNLSSSEVS